MSVPTMLLCAVGLLAPAAPAKDLDPGPTAVLKDSRPDPKDAKANEQFLRGQIDRVRASRVIRLALKDSNVSSNRLLERQNDPVSWLREHLMVTVQPDAGTLSVALPGFDRVDQMTLVNAIVDAYLEDLLAERDKVFTRNLKIAEVHRQAIASSLEGLLGIPPLGRDAVMESRIVDLRKELEYKIQSIQEYRRELETPNRLQWHQRARGRQ
jgi:hypothetical protein